MQSARKQSEPDAALLSSRSDPYRGTPLGMEAAWCPNGMDLPAAAAAMQTPMRPLED